MKNQEAIEMLTAKAECIRREASGIDVDCNHRNCDECDLCYKQGTMGDQMEALGVAISALQAQEAKNSTEGSEELKQEVKNSKESSSTHKALDTISRQAALDALDNIKIPRNASWYPYYQQALTVMSRLPSAQPEPLSDAYTKAVWTWLLDYQIKAAELKGRYTPYEVLSWVANDWRKEHEGSD